MSEGASRARLRRRHRRRHHLRRCRRRDAPDDAPGVSPLFHHKAHKQLRVALQPLLGELRGQLGHYGKDPKAFRAAKQSKRDLNRRKIRRRRPTARLNQTRMRAARLERLAALEAGHAELPLAIGDGENPSGANPSGADASAENPSAGDPSADPDQAPRRAPLPLVPDGCSGDAAASHSISDASGSSNPTILNQPRQCYVCKCRFRRLHHFSRASVPSAPSSTGRSDGKPPTSPAESPSSRARA